MYWKLSYRIYALPTTEYHLGSPKSTLLTECEIKSSSPSRHVNQVELKRESK